MSVGEILNSRKIAEVNTFFPNVGRKSCQAADLGKREWTAALVAERLIAAFARKHRAIDNRCQSLKPVWGLVTSHEDYIPDLEQLGMEAIDRPKRMTDGNFRSSRWYEFDTPAQSDFTQLCYKGAWFGEGDPDTPEGPEFFRDRPRRRTAYKDASALLRANGCREEDGALNSDLEGPERRREQEREDARRFAETRTAIRDDPKSFAELASTDVLDRKPIIVDDDLLALEAQGWIVRKREGEQVMETAELEADRLLTLAWLKSGMTAPAFCRRSRTDILIFADRVRSYIAALTDRLNNERAPVKPVVWRLDYRKEILQGAAEIARSLNLSIGNVQKKIDAGLVPVAAVGGTIIASEKMIRHMRKHYSSPERARSQAASV
jgi:hypothetical protein